VVGNRLQETGPQTDMVMDFGLISQAIKKHLSGLDHSHLNDTLGTDSPTAEVLAQWIYRRLEPDLPGLVAVTIAETPLSSCRYEELGLVPL
jgi:6-pyruvoyltetrahydropterin/6-carboxytetrahydropterin synthase